MLPERELLTPPLDGLILPGITRQSIIELSQQWGEFKVIERKITMPEIQQLLNEKRVSFPLFSLSLQSCLSTKSIKHIKNLFREEPRAEYLYP